jgi:hypothetical protein
VLLTAVLNPATEEVIREVHAASAGETDAAVAAVIPFEDEEEALHRSPASAASSCMHGLEGYSGVEDPPTARPGRRYGRHPRNGGAEDVRPRATA